MSNPNQSLSAGTVAAGITAYGSLLGRAGGEQLALVSRATDQKLSRRDQGLEFLDVTSQLHFRLVDSDRDDGRQTDRYRITNNSTTVVDTHLLLIAKGLPAGVQMANASGLTGSGEPYLRVFLPEGVLLPGQSIERSFSFHVHNAPKTEKVRPRYTINAQSGQGKGSML